MKVQVLEVYRHGEHCELKLFATKEAALREASSLLMAVLTDEKVLFIEEASVESPEGTGDFIEEMKCLYAREGYETLVMIWDDWVAAGEYDTEYALPFNFDITEKEVVF